MVCKGTLYKIASACTLLACFALLVRANLSKLISNGTPTTSHSGSDLYNYIYMAVLLLSLSLSLSLSLQPQAARRLVCVFYYFSGQVTR